MEFCAHLGGLFLVRRVLLGYWAAMWIAGLRRVPAEWPGRRHMERGGRRGGSRGTLHAFTGKLQESTSEGLV